MTELTEKTSDITYLLPFYRNLTSAFEDRHALRGREKVAESNEEAVFEGGSSRGGMKPIAN